MERDDMRTMVRDIARIESHDVTDAQLDVYLDEGYLEVTTNRDWPWCYSLTPVTQTLVAGTDEYALASTVKRIVGVRNDDQDYSLKAISQANWAHFKNRDTNSTPEFYTFANGTLHISPPPSATDDLIIEYYTHPAFAAADDDEPVFDEAFHQLLVDWCLSRLWEMEEDFEKADDYRTRYEIRLVRMSKFYNTEVVERPMIYGEMTGPTPPPGSGAWFAYEGMGT